MRERAWQNRGSGEYDDPVTLADVQARLGPERALVAHVVTEPGGRRAGGHLGDGLRRRSRTALRAGRPHRWPAARPRHGGGRAAGPLRGCDPVRAPQPARAPRRRAGRAVGRGDRRSRAGAHAVGCPGRRAVDDPAEQPRPTGHRRAVGDVVAVAQHGRSAIGVRGLRRRAAGRPGRGRDLGGRVNVAARDRPARGRGDRVGGERAGRVGRRAPRVGARAALLGEPAVLRLRARRRSVVRLRHRPAHVGARRGPAVGVRGRPLHVARWRGADRDDRRVAARRLTLRDRLGRGDQRRGRARRTRGRSTASCPPAMRPRPRWRGRSVEVDPDGPPAPLVCFG